MKLTETIQVNKSVELSKVCHLAKNLYNSANWYFRQDFFNLNNFLSYYDLDFMLKHKQAYKKNYLTFCYIHLFSLISFYNNKISFLIL